MRYLSIIGLALLVQLIGLPAQAATPDDIRAGHRDAARRLLTVLDAGVVLKGDVEQNGSQGKFEGYFIKDTWLVRETFGSMSNESYIGPEGDWSGTNYALPYRINPEDNPTHTVLSLISNGAYLEEPYWPYFKYVAEEAGGYRCAFTPPGLPPVDIVLYSDEDSPGYLQIMSSEVSWAPEDPQASRHRNFFYYAKDSQGRLYSNRETGKDVDDKGQEIDFSDYTVTSFEVLGHRPPELHFDMQRTPVGNPGAALTAPVKVDAVTKFGYFIVPLTFANGQTLNFILDTGASASLFTPAAVAAAGLETNYITTAHGHGTRLSFEIGMVSGAALGTGDNKVPLAPFPATKIEESSRDVLRAMESYQAAGIIGVAPLHQYVITLDHDGKSITAIPPQLFDPAKSLSGPYLTYSLDVEDLIYAKARVNDSLVGQIALDTGLQQDLALLRETMDLSGLSFEKVGTQQNTVVGGARDFDYVKVPSFDLGPLRLEGRVASLTEDDRGTLTARRMLGFLGLSLFAQARVTLDLFNERMYVEPPPQLAEQMQQKAPQLFTGIADDLYQNGPSTAGIPKPFGGPPSAQPGSQEQPGAEAVPPVDQPKQQQSGDGPQPG
jgi:hypothetical protein